MALREWVRLPSHWIRAGALCELQWAARGGSAHNTAALMVLIGIAHFSDGETGKAVRTYDQLGVALGLSRTMIARGIERLRDLNLVANRAAVGRSDFQLVNYDVERGWCKLPMRRLYAGQEIVAFRDFHLRNRSELNALKLYLLFAAFRDDDTNMAQISFDKIETYTGIERNLIREGITRLAAAGLVHVEHVPSTKFDRGVSNAYRLTYLNPYIHMGTRGRRDLADFTLPE